MQPQPSQRKGKRDKSSSEERAYRLGGALQNPSNPQSKRDYLLKVPRKNGAETKYTRMIMMKVDKVFELGNKKYLVTLRSMQAFSFSTPLEKMYGVPRDLKPLVREWLDELDLPVRYVIRCYPRKGE